MYTIHKLPYSREISSPPFLNKYFAKGMYFCFECTQVLKKRSTTGLTNSQTAFAIIVYIKQACDKKGIAESIHVYISRATTTT